jgi:hypothetical protein
MLQKEAKSKLKDTKDMERQGTLKNVTKSKKIEMMVRLGTLD